MNKEEVTGQYVAKGLSQREAEVSFHVLQGKNNQAIANDLFVTDKTVKFHLTSVYRKLGIKSRTQLIANYFGGSNIQP